jgi:hypothetical protein
MPIQVSLDVDAVVTGIHIEPSDPPRLIIMGEWRLPGGDRVRSFQEDVTDALTDGQRTTLAALVTRAQTWLAART